MVSIPLDQHELDVTEKLIQEFARNGCKCDLGPNHTPSIRVDHFRSVHCQMADLTHDELDLGQVMAGCFLAETFRRQERSRSFTCFNHNGSRICQTTFLFMHTMGYSRFKAIKASFLDTGMVARVHGNKGKSSRKDRLTLEQIQDVIQFFMNYAGVCVCVCMSERERERLIDHCCHHRHHDCCHHHHHCQCRHHHHHYQQASSKAVTALWSMWATRAQCSNMP